MNKEKLYVAEKIDPSLPLLIIDMSEGLIMDDEELEKNKHGLYNEADLLCNKTAKRILHNLLNLTHEEVMTIYTTTQDPLLAELKTKNYQQLPSWWDQEKGGLSQEFVNALPERTLQICGAFRELCLYQLCTLLKEKEIETILITSEEFSLPSYYVLSEDPESALENQAERDEFELVAYEALAK